MCKEEFLLIRAILVDDEPLAAQLLERKLSAFENITVVKIYSNPMHVVEDLQHVSYNVAFLDIEMPGINGLDLAELILNATSNVHIVFITAYREYAVQAFELNSIDYLVKPLTDDRLEKTIERVQQQLISVPQMQKKKDYVLRIQCFSDFNVMFGQEPVKWTTAKVKELFALLLTHHQTYINRDLLIETLWPDTEYAKAKIQLHTSLSRLRKTLETLGYDDAITFANSSYCLELTDFQFDLISIKQLYEEYPTVQDDTIEQFQQIIELYQGDYLESEGYKWSHTYATKIRLQVIELLERMILYYEQLHDYTNTQVCLEQLLQLDPYSEQILQKLLRHYIKIDRRTEAIRAYQQFKDQLDIELGISPSQSTIELYSQVLCVE